MVRPKPSHPVSWPGKATRPSTLVHSTGASKPSMLEGQKRVSATISAVQVTLPLSLLWTRTAKVKSGVQVGTTRWPRLQTRTLREFLRLVQAEDSSTSVPTKSQPKGVAATPSAIYTASSAGLEIHPVSGGSGATHPGATSAVAAHSGDSDIIAFGASTKKVVLATVSGSSVKIEAEFEDNKGEVLSLAFSPDGSLLAAGDVSFSFQIFDR